MFELLCLVALAAFATFVSAADCTTATVGSPYNDCFDIYTNASLTAAQFAADKPGLNCSLLQIGQQVCISAGTLPSTAPSASANGTCYEYFVDPNDSCSSIAVKFDITVAEIETYNINTFKWTGCAGLQAGFTMCVSPGTPPPIPVIPDLECGPQSAGNATCPLNACCSAFGFCGLTEEFCTTALPNPWPQHEEHRLLRGLADRRPCGVVRPGDIDWSAYTHAHFAFAVISQDSEIQLASADEPLLQELVGLKASNPPMKVLISIGGWDFLEADPTRHLFSIMIGSAATRSTFISSVQTFLTTYDLDGIDIDFEYPGAIERDAPATRSGNPEDYKGANISVDMLGATRVTAKLCREFIKILCLQLE